MASSRQRARMAAVQSALDLLRQRRFITGYNLVVLGGACAPSTKFDTSVFDSIGRRDFDPSDFAYPRSSLSPIALLGRHLVVSGGVLTTANTHPNRSIDTLAKCGTFLVHTRCNLQPRPSLPPFTDTFYSVVLGHFQLWPRTGVG